MNREIKFRIWDKCTKRFETCVYETNKDCYLFIGRSGYVTAFNCYGEEIDFQDGRFIIQQYTGLKDKNGKEIYEGDIVYGFCLNDGPQICVVGFDTWGIYYTKIKHYPCEEWENIAMLAQEHNEVIGNIMETPELIKNNDNNNQ
jgi:uncharacterized phage protein (TIGR01671 family)